MAEKTLYWGDGTSDTITVSYSGAVGDSEAIVVPNSPNLTSSERSRTILFKTLDGKFSAPLTVTQKVGGGKPVVKTVVLTIGSNFPVHINVGFPQYDEWGLLLQKDVPKDDYTVVAVADQFIEINTAYYEFQGWMTRENYELGNYYDIVSPEMYYAMTPDADFPGAEQITLIAYYG